jgi:hypothetical protein
MTPVAIRNYGGFERKLQSVECWERQAQPAGLTVKRNEGIGNDALVFSPEKLSEPRKFARPQAGDG